MVVCGLVFSDAACQFCYSSQMRLWPTAYIKMLSYFGVVFFSLFMYSPASVIQEVTWFLATIPFTTHTGQIRFNAMVQSTRSISDCPHSTNITGSNHFMDAAITCRPTLEGQYRSLCLLYSLHLLLWSQQCILRLVTAKWVWRQEFVQCTLHAL